MIDVTQIQLPADTNTFGHKTLPNGRKKFCARQQYGRKTMEFRYPLSLTQNFQQDSNRGVFPSVSSVPLF